MTPTVSGIVTVNPMPTSILREAGTDLLPELQTRLRGWADRVAVAEMTELEIVSNMDAFTRAVVSGDGGTTNELRARELMMRRTLICGRLPADHEYHGEEHRR